MCVVLLQSAESENDATQRRMVIRYSKLWVLDVVCTDATATLRYGAARERKMIDARNAKLFRSELNEG